MKTDKWKILPVALVLAISLTGCATRNAVSTPPAETSNPSQGKVQTIAPASTSSADAASNAAQSVSPTQTASADQPSAPAETPVADASENPLAPEKNPPGDIPDTQVFVNYANASGGYELQSPEGWARTEKGTDVTFVDKFDGVQVAVTQSSDPFTVESIKSNQAVTLQKTGRAVQIRSILEKNTKGGKAVLITYESNSEPDAVTGKQIRLEDQCYYFDKDGKLAALTLWAPLGADNVDQWKLMSDSFRWQ